MQKLRLFFFFDVPVIQKKMARFFKPTPIYGSEAISLPLTEKSSKTIGNLINKSHQRPMALETVVPWEIGVNRSLPPKRMDQLWMYGTPYWDALSGDQRLEVAWIETARDVSMFIRFEQLIPTLYVGYINRYGKSLPPEVYEYLMIFAKEEIVHTLMFQRFMKMSELPQFSPPVAYTKLVALLPEMHPSVGILYTLIIEWTAELGVMHGTQGHDVDPLTREMFKQHHIDEVRHIGFACNIVEDYFASAPESELKKIRRMFRRMIPKFINEFRYNAEIARHTSFQFPIVEDDADAISTIRNSAHYERLDNERFKDMFAWLKKLDLI